MPSALHSRVTNMCSIYIIYINACSSVCCNYNHRHSLLFVLLFLFPLLLLLLLLFCVWFLLQPFLVFFVFWLFFFFHLFMQISKWFSLNELRQGKTNKKSYKHSMIPSKMNENKKWRIDIRVPLMIITVKQCNELRELTTWMKKWTLNCYSHPCHNAFRSLWLSSFELGFMRWLCDSMLACIQKSASACNYTQCIPNKMRATVWCCLLVIWLCIVVVVWC